MGPQLDSCGRLARLVRTVRIQSLQWGRNLIVAEGYRQHRRPVQGVQLQWGRNLIVAEGTEATETSTCVPSLQWGRNLIVAEGAVGLSPRCTAR